MSSKLHTELVLVGGGHSHAIALKLWSQNPLPKVNLTLISDVKNTPYSGMLPGHVAGFYTYQETHINLSHLAKVAGAKLIIDKAVDLDLNSNQVMLQRHQPMSFDYLSLDIGSTPKTSTVPGADQYAIAAKPVPLFLNAWYQLLKTVQNNPKLPFKIIIIGGGAGGVELALNMFSRLQKLRPATFSDSIEIALIHRGKQLLSGHNSQVSQLLHRLLIKKGIKLYLNTEVTEIKPDRVITSDRQTINTDYTFWVTQADSPQWIKNSGLATDNQGFILVNHYLQSMSHSQVFATGDIATIKDDYRPKAGVFAVRQGKPLYQNWQKMITNQSLKPYTPQKKYLSLIGTGDQRAIASWGNFCWHSFLLWYLKDYIDRKFMNQFFDS